MNDHTKEYSVVLVGVGGYGTSFLRRLLRDDCDLPMKLVGGVDPFASASPRYQDLLAAGIPLYDTLEEFYAQHTADIAIVSTPIHLHKEQSIYCLEHGSHVMCEKPICAVVDDIEAMKEAAARTGKELFVGFQWNYSDAIRTMKEDVLAGKYGALKRMKTLVLWPRDFAYYRRGIGWAARKKAGSGEWILDSVANNATAHYLNNMLFTAGKRLSDSADIESITVQTYRANPIEMYDTCALRAKTADGIPLLYLASHAICKPGMRGPEFVFEFEGGRIEAKVEDRRGVVVRGYLADGSEVEYGCPNQLETCKLDWMLKVLEEGAPHLCSPDTAKVHTSIINRIEELIPNTPFLPQEMIVTDEKEQMIYGDGLDALLTRCFDEWKLPCELEPAFGEAVTGSMIGYEHFAET